jgi:hypothetical protein
MTVASDLIELRRMEAATDVDASALAALPTCVSVFAYIAAAAKAENRDPAHDVELLARHAGMTPNEVRDIATTLRRLGFRSASDRLRHVAGRRYVTLRPLRERTDVGNR